MVMVIAILVTKGYNTGYALGVQGILIYTLKATTTKPYLYEVVV